MSQLAAEVSQTKKPIIAFTVADEKNLAYAKMLEKSFQYFHPDIPFFIYGEEDLKKIADPMKFYKSTPLFARRLIQEYNLVIKLDADQLILGDLSYLFHQPYDVGSVLNINRVDPPRYGIVAGWGIAPNEYLNCGLVAMRSEKFIEHWWNLCNSDYFMRFPYREQDILNILMHFGGYKTLCFDHFNKIDRYSAWHGLVAKGEGVRAVMKEGKVIIPRGEDGYPDKDVELKAYHWAGGQGELKMDYQKHFSEEVIEFIDEILK